MGRRWAGRIGGALCAVAAVKFLAFVPHLMAVGGSAGNGKWVEGRYYVGHHGRFTEVTEWQWQVMRAHEVSVLVTHPLAIFVAGPLLTYAGRGRRPDPARHIGSGTS